LRARDICNLALLRIGHELITEDKDPPSLTAPEKAAAACNLLYEPARDLLLRSHPWNFAMRRTLLAPAEKAITGATQADPVVITCAGHGFTDGRWVYITMDAGMTDLNGNKYKVASAATNTFALQDDEGDVDGTGFGAYTSGGTARLVPAFGYAYAYGLPSDCLRVWELQDTSSPWEVEDNLLMVDDEAVNLRYLRQVTDPTRFTMDFCHALALFMGISLAKQIADSESLAAEIRQEFTNLLFDARTGDARDGAPAELEVLTDWQKAGRI